VISTRFNTAVVSRENEKKKRTVLPCKKKERAEKRGWLCEIPGTTNDETTKSCKNSYRHQLKKGGGRRGFQNREEGTREKMGAKA